jgi:hypothetical protein
VRPSPADRQSPRQPSETGRLYKASRVYRSWLELFQSGVAEWGPETVALLVRVV